MVFAVLLDGNIYDKLDADEATRDVVVALSAEGKLRIIATPVVEGELRRSHFGGIPAWFPVDVLSEAVFVFGHAQLGRACLGAGKVYTEHRGESKKIRDGILADSADILADVLVSEDKRCRDRLKKISTKCRGLTYEEFRTLFGSFSEQGAV